MTRDETSCIQENPFTCRGETNIGKGHEIKIDQNRDRGSFERRLSMSKACSLAGSAR